MSVSDIFTHTNTYTYTHTHTHTRTSPPLTAHQAEVHAVVERAEKDVAIESLLNTFEEV